MNFEDEYLEQLILEGIVEFAGLDKDGEMLYSFADDLEQKAPGLFRLIIEEQMRDIYELWQLGFLSMDVTEDNPLVRPTMRALDDDEVDRLPQQLRITLERIKYAARHGLGG